ncbi:hypothetical protein D479_01887 [Halobacillus sp. BAB-2008]|nr:hypothetical protein D479_01887 [Halobacillus sp. BAB-2008]
MLNFICLPPSLLVVMSMTIVPRVEGRCKGYAFCAEGFMRREEASISCGKRRRTAWRGEAEERKTQA